MLRKSGTRLSFLTMHIKGVVAFVVSSTLGDCSKNRLYTRLCAKNEEGWEEISTPASTSGEMMSECKPSESVGMSKPLEVSALLLT